MWRWSRFQRHNLVVFFLIHLGGAFLFFNSHFAGKVALELGPAPDGACFFFVNSLENQKVHEKGCRESCGALDRCILHRISVRTTLWWRHFFGSGSTFWFFTKRVAVRAQKLSTIAFCTEFLCESNCGVAFFPAPTLGNFILQVSRQVLDIFCINSAFFIFIPLVRKVEGYIV